MKSNDRIERAMMRLSVVQQRIAKAQKLATQASNDLAAGSAVMSMAPLSLLDVEARLLQRDLNDLIAFMDVITGGPAGGADHG